MVATTSQGNIMDEKRMKRKEELEERQKRVKARAGPAPGGIEGFDPLSRGFAIAVKKNGRILRRTAGLPPWDALGRFYWTR